MSVIIDYLPALRAAYSRASALQIAEGRLWYPMARGQLFDLAQRYGVSVKRAAFAAAALSNNIEWDQNVALLEHVIWSVKTSTEPRGHFPACLKKAVAILKHGQFDALSGPKVEPFARALLGDTNAAVVDRWIWRAAGGIDGKQVTTRRARDVGVALRLLGREVHRPASDVQAIIWLATREGV